jgi:deazaflavin-dependent oxidoreductase (nitroreductase family)
MGLANLMFDLSGGRMKVQGRPLLRLTTVGARTGRRRRTVLGWFPDPDRSDAWIVVGSANGAARHPGWCHNLARNPMASIEVGKQQFQVTAQSLKGTEREEAWRSVVALSHGYGRYAVMTDREIPIIRLTPAA